MNGAVQEPDVRSLLAHRLAAAWRPAVVAAAPPTPDHWALLAGTRFILASAVFMSHFMNMETPFLSEAAGSAVLAFFIISGFSIGHSYSSRPKGYLRRRIWRIWPTYLFGFFCLAVPTYFWAMPAGSAEHGGHSVWPILGNLFMLQGIFVLPISTNVPTWSLAVEEWLYLLAPVFRRMSLLLLYPLIFASATAYVVAYRMGYSQFQKTLDALTHACMAWAWLAGFAFYLQRDRPLARLWLLVFPVMLVAYAKLSQDSLAPILMVLTCVLMAYGDRLKLPLSVVELFNYLGNLSYPIYILHSPVFIAMDKLRSGQPRSLVLYAAAVLGVSALVYHFIDKPNRISHHGPRTMKDEGGRKS